MTHSDPAKLKEQGRTFDCSVCPQAVQKLRRCREPRWDFTEEDNGSVFPIYIHRGGELFGFCPGKATWDYETVALFRILMISATTGAMLRSGGIEDQPDWFVELLSWFIPRYDSLKFTSKAAMILKEPKAKTAAQAIMPP